MGASACVAWFLFSTAAIPDYRSDETHSPLTGEVVRHLLAIAARDPERRDDSLMRIGDSNSVSLSALVCGQASGRVGVAAKIGWTVADAVAGSPSPVQVELAHNRARFASVMFGTNDLARRDVSSFARDLAALLDTLTEAGVIPFVTSIPPRDDSPAADAWVPTFNWAARQIAQSKGVPFVDLHRELLALPGHGLDADGIHLKALGPGRACAFSQQGLTYGHNLRNWLIGEAMHRVRQALRTGVALDDPPLVSETSLVQ